MDTLEIGKKLVDLCKNGENIKAIESLYSPDIVSIEAIAMPDFPKEMRGVDAIKKKNQDWERGAEIHSSEAHGPFPAGDRFAIYYKYDMTNKKTNKRSEMEEMALYTVKDGKIVKEEFFYH